MTLDKVIAMVQSNIARRGVELADLEAIYSIRKATAYTKSQYKLLRAVREEIKPVAQQQKTDRIVLRELTTQRTSARRIERETAKSLMSFPMFTAGVFYLDPEGVNSGLIRLVDSNKYTFPG